MLLSNHIAGFFDHQYLWIEIISVLDFLYRSIYQIQIVSKSATAVLGVARLVQRCLDTPRLARAEFVDLRVNWLQ